VCGWVREGREGELAAEWDVGVCRRGRGRGLDVWTEKRDGTGDVVGGVEGS
jgi:hypothetical protein